MSPLLLFNPTAGGGRARLRMANLDCKSENAIYRAQILEGPFHKNRRQIETYIRRGGANFIAAGGDGTIFDLINGLHHLCYDLDIPLTQLTVGALALGSSNDFHKCDTSIGSPARLDFSRNQLFDLIEVRSPTWKKTLITPLNVHLGFTALGNHFFNHPDFCLSWLKPRSTAAAIFYTSLKTFFSYEPIELSIDGTSSQILNLGVVKSRYFAGDFHYPKKVDWTDGSLGFFFLPWISKCHALKALRSLEKGRFDEIPGAIFKKRNQIKIKSEHEFLIEVGGEVLSTQEIELKILPRGLRACPYV